MPLTCDQTMMCLPDPPEWGHYEVEQVSPMVQKVWLVHDRPYVHSDDPVRTIWGFIKGTKVHPPRSHKQMRPKSVSQITDAWRLSCYTTIVPQGPTNLWHLG